MMTPLKKRMLRHSIAEDRLTTTPPPANVLLDDKLRSQSTPSTPVVADDTLQQSGADGVSTTDSPRKSESGADGLATPSTPVQAEVGFTGALASVQTLIVTNAVDCA